MAIYKQLPTVYRIRTGQNKTRKQMKQTALHGAVPAPRPRSLERVDHPSQPVLEYVGDVADGVAMREKIPSTSSVAVVVEPGAEDQIGRGEEEETVSVVRRV